MDLMDFLSDSLLLPIHPVFFRGACTNLKLRDGTRSFSFMPIHPASLSYVGLDSIDILLKTVQYYNFGEEVYVVDKNPNKYSV